MLASHEPLAVGYLDFVLHDLPRSVTLGDSTTLALYEHMRTSGESEHRLRVCVVERMQTTMPMNPERPNAMHLHGGACRRIAEHPAAFRSERVAAWFEFLKCLSLELLAQRKVPGALNYGDMFIDGMR